MPCRLSGLTMATRVTDTRVQHFVSWKSVKNDGVSDQVSVARELEPGTAIFEPATMPEPQVARLDDPDH